MAKGTYTAYQKLQPIKVDWGKVAETGVNREDELYARKQAEAKARQERRDKLGYDQLEPVITGIDSLDKGLTLGIQEASTLQHEDYKRALNDPAFADSSEYKIRTKNLNNYAKNVKTFSDGFAELAQQTIAKSQDGSLSSWDNDLLQTLNGGFVSEKVKFGVAEDGSVQAFIASTDRNAITDENPDGYIYDEDGKIKMTKVTPNEVFKGLGKFSITPDVDIQKEATEIGTELGKSIESNINGYTVTAEQSWESKKEETRKIVRGLLGTPKNPTAMAKRLWADEMGMDSRNLSESDMTLIEDKMLDKVKPFYDEEVKKTKNFAAQESARKRAEARSKDEVTPAITPDVNTGKPAVVTVPGTNKRGYSVSFGDNTALKLEDTESTATFAKNIYFTEEGVYADLIQGNKRTGDFVFKEGTNEIDTKASFATGKGWVSNTTTKKLTDTELQNIAKDNNVKKPSGGNFKDSKEFVDFLKNQFKEMGGDPDNKPKPSSGGGEFDDL